MRLNQRVFPATAAALLSALVVMSVMLAAASIASAQQSSAAVRKAIVAASAEFSAAFARGDGAGVAALYSESAQVFQPNGNIINGRAAIQTFWQGGIDSGLKQAKLETVEVYGTGALVAEVGTYSVLGGNGEVLDSGKYIVLWKREKGKWRLYRDIWNSNNPARS